MRPNFLLREFVSYDLLCSMQECFLGTLKDKRWHTFCDDFHSSFAHSMIQQHENSDATIQPLAEFLFDLLSNDVSDSDQKPRSLWISCDLMQTVQFGFWGNGVLYKKTFNHLFELFVKHIKLPLSGNLRNHHGIALLLMDLMEKFLEMNRKNREKLHQIIPHQGFNHYIQGFTTKLYCVLGKESNLAKDRMTKIIRKELKLIHKSYEAASLHNYKLAVIPVYNHVSVLNVAMSGSRGKWGKKIASTVAAELEELKSLNIKNSFTDYVKYAVSIEFPCAILIVDLSSPRSKDTAHSSSSFQYSLMNILAHIYVGVSRARVYCSIILICSDDETNKLYKEVLNILKPHVKTIEVRQKDIISSTPVHSSSHKRHRQSHFIPFRTFHTSKAVLILCDSKNDSFDCSQLHKPITANKHTVFCLEDLNRYSQEVHESDIVLISAGIYDIIKKGLHANILHDHVRDFIVQFPKTRFIFESVTALECDGSRKNSEINKTIDRFNKLMFRCSLDHDNIDYFDNVRFRQTHLSADGLYLDHNGQAEQWRNDRPC